jgi:uncharacterized protein YjbI with pentapeptide repeats
MNERLHHYVNGVFAPYDGVRSVAELKADLLADLQERFDELRTEGKDDATAFEMTVDSIGDIEQTVREVANLSRTLERQLLTTFSDSNLEESDFAGVTARNGTFEASALRGADFSGADLTGSSFAACDMRDARFDGTNLADCRFSTVDLAGATFDSAVLVRTAFGMSGLKGARFTDLHLVDVDLDMCDLKGATFERCLFTGVDFRADLTGVCLDGQTFIGVGFGEAALKNASFRGATLKNVSFAPPRFLTGKYHRAIRTILFDGATMDKLTYAGLKGLGADLSGVAIA